MNTEIQKTATPSAAQLEQINLYTRRPMKPEEVYVFSAVLCDNEVDRDYECFTAAALERLAELFVGKTGIFDHDHSSRSQSARVFAAKTRAFPERRSALGEVYTQLVAEAYVPRGAETKGLIEAIDSGILKEVSVGCAVGKRRCSVCGAENCGHMRGTVYEGETCVRILEDPTDAYEFSFVAVPAQRAAGVVKRFQRDEKKEGTTMENELQKLFQGESVTLSGEALSGIRAQVRALEKRAACGDRYRESLCGSVRRLSAVVQPGLRRELVDEMTKGLSIELLEEMRGALEKEAAGRMPVYAQTARAENTEKTPENTAFCI